MEDNDHILIEIPRSKQLRKTIITLVVTIGLTTWVLAYLSLQDQIGLQTLWLLPSFLVGLFLSFKFWSTTHIEQLTPAAQEKIREQEAEECRKQEEYDDKWYFRYPIAIFMLYGAYWIINERENLWWAAILALLVAAFQAREVSLFLLAGGIIYLIFQVVSALPVSLAIVLGAIIIASSLKK